MGYESLEKDSLITLERILSLFTISSRKKEETQIEKDAKYELNRIRKELEKY